nr:ribonuclease H-like domain-containing protein [Tanacetum cinerariifolium]
MDSLSPQVFSAAKLPILNPNEFDLWKIRIEQYFLMNDYSLWEVILNGDSPAPTRVVEGVLQPVAPTTAEQKLARKNELKARGTLLMALRDKRQLKFNSHKDAKTLMEAIEKRLQKLVSQLEIHRVSLSQEDVNLNLDDLFNSLKIYEAEVKSSSSTGTTKQNLDFVSSSNTNCTTESVSVAASVSTVCAKMLVSSLPNVDSLSNARTGRNLRANGPTFLGFDMSKLECYNCHMKGHYARECRSPKDSRRNGAAELHMRKEEPAYYALMAFSSSSSFSDNEIRSYSKACSKAYAQLQSQYDKLAADFHKSQFDVISYQIGLESIEARLLVYKQNESVFEEDIKLLKLESDESWPPSSLYDRFQPSDGYHAVPPPYSGTFMPPKLDLVFNTTPTAVETDHSAFNVQLSPTKPDQDLSHINRPTAPIIEDWVSDSEDESETKTPQIVPSFVHPSPKTSNSPPRVTAVKAPVMCDKKNSVLFTDTECLVLSLDFKLPDESQVLLRVPRENNMYNVNLKNIVPSGDLTCLFTKATLMNLKFGIEGWVKENQEKDKIGSKPDKNGKRVKAGKSLKQLQRIKEENPKKMQKEWSKTHTRSKSYSNFKRKKKRKGPFLHLQESSNTRA